MEEHENEERELVSGMERALATAVATTASLIESYMRRQAQRDRNTSSRPGSSMAEEQTTSIKELIGIQQEARSELALFRDDGDLWRSASYDQLNDQVMREHGIDPHKVGESTADKEWITRASGEEILDVFASADRWAGRSDVAHKVRDNIAAELADYGLDLNELLGLPRGAAAEQIEAARAEQWAHRDHDREGTPAEQVEAQRDGQHVERLLDQASSADQTAREAEAHSTADTATAQQLSTTATEQPVNRSAQAAEHAGTSAAGRAAAVAARDHPSNPRTATTSRPKQGPKVKPRSPKVQRDQSRGR